MAILVSILILICLFFVERSIPTSVQVNYTSLAGTQTFTCTTKAKNVQGLIKELNYDITEEDLVDPERKTAIRPHLVVNITKSARSTAVIKGESADITMYPVSVEENLKINKIDYDDEDIITPSLGAVARKGTKIEVQDVEIKTTEKEGTVKAKTLKNAIFDKSVASGTITESEGKNGKGLFKYTTKFINGKKVAVQKDLVKVIVKPKHKVTKFGTKDTGETGEVKYTRTFISNTTAYYMGDTAVGAGGTRCHYGTCAVDPSVIPYGTKLYVEGYGYAVANDTGTAIKGTKLDLYMHNYNESLQWGRRHVRVYVLE